MVIGTAGRRDAHRLAPHALLISALTAALLACSVVATATVRRHPRGAYTRTERRHLDAARVQWPTSRADLTRHPNAARLLHDWDSRLASDRTALDRLARTQR